jgi:hypothetical protein
MAEETTSRLTVRAARPDEGRRLEEIAIGGRYVRDGESSAWGRIQPIMELDLGD